MFDQVTIVGLGLIGGSLGLAVKKRRIARRVIGFSRHAATLRRAKARGAVDDGDTEFCPDWLGESDLVVIATPPLTVVSVARKVAQLTRHRFLLTDVASTKDEIVRTLEKILPSRIAYVGSHPMAGLERSGIEAANAHLFEGAACIVTPTRKSSPHAVAGVSAFWRSIGGQVVPLSPDRHDTLVAQMSHVPHLAAATLALFPRADALKLAGGGFSDMTRIALSDPSLWREICSTNRKEIVKALDHYIRSLRTARSLLAPGKETALHRWLLRAQRRRQHLTR